MQDQGIAVIRRPELLRWAVVITLILMGGFCGLIGLSLFAQSVLPALALVVIASGCLWLAWATFQTDCSSVMFDGERIYTNSGVELCRLDEVADLQRGMAMLKPSGGFIILLTGDAPRGWSPGLWWRYGTRIGVGGAVSTRACKHMADSISGALAARMVAAAEADQK